MFVWKGRGCSFDRKTHTLFVPVAQLAWSPVQIGGVSGQLHFWKQWSQVCPTDPVGLGQIVFVIEAYIPSIIQSDLPTDFH